MAGFVWIRLQGLNCNPKGCYWKEQASSLETAKSTRYGLKFIDKYLCCKFKHLIFQCGLC